MANTDDQALIIFNLSESRAHVSRFWISDKFKVSTNWLKQRVARNFLLENLLRNHMYVDVKCTRNFELFLLVMCRCILRLMKYFDSYGYINVYRVILVIKSIGF